MSIDTLSSSMADFAVNLYKKISESAGKDEDIFLSPFSISYALAMCYAGANTTTKDEMKRVLFGTQTNLSDQAVHDSFAEIMTALNKPTAVYKLSIANRLYANEKFAEKLLQSFVDLLSKKYSSDLQLTNFAEQNGEVARKKINDWVSEKTNSKIQDVIAAGVLQEATRLVLVNAIYFKGDWATPFKKKATHEKAFYAAPNKELKVQTMHKYGVSYPYGETDKFQILGIPYKGGELAMFIVLPKERYGLDALEKELTGKKLLDAISQTNRTEVEVIAFPKFKLLQSFSLADVLQQMGAAQMFTDDADFSNISGKKDLKVSDVIHKAFVEVNEEGTEAAAATAVTVMLCSAQIPPPNRPQFIADHPFLFCIYDERSKSVLFLGKFAKGE